MRKAKIHFPQVPVEIAERVAKAESNGHASVAVKLPKKRPNRSTPADRKSVTEEDL